MLPPGHLIPDRSPLVLIHVPKCQLMTTNSALDAVSVVLSQDSLPLKLFHPTLHLGLAALRCFQPCDGPFRPDFKFAQGCVKLGNTSTRRYVSRRCTLRQRINGLLLLYYAGTKDLQLRVCGSYFSLGCLKPTLESLITRS